MNALSLSLFVPLHLTMCSAIHTFMTSTDVDYLPAQKSLTQLFCSFVIYGSICQLVFIRLLI